MRGASTDVTTEHLLRRSPSLPRSYIVFNLCSVDSHIPTCSVHTPTRPIPYMSCHHCSGHSELKQYKMRFSFPHYDLCMQKQRAALCNSGTSDHSPVRIERLTSQTPRFETRQYIVSQRYQTFVLILSSCHKNMGEMS